ncbi:MAG: hypothetical protein ACK4OJ_02955 [Brevundimonas sp.]
MVALQAHGVIDTQHRIEHALQFPGVSYAEAATIDQDQEADHGDEHARDQPESPPTGEAATSDVPDKSIDGPIKHHHHNAGEIHVALATPVHPSEAVISASGNLAPAAGLTPPGLRGDGPSHPPKQQRLIA